MLTLIHGTDTITSRDYLNELITKEKNLVRHDGAKLTPEQLTLDLQPTTLLGSNNLLLIENLFSRKDLTGKKALLNLLNANRDIDVVLWEGKPVAKTDLALLPKAQAKEFILRPRVFAFLDSLGKPAPAVLTAFHQALEQDPVEKLMATLATRLRQLLIAQVDPDHLSAQGFYRSKLIGQSHQFSKVKLEKLLRQLLSLDFAQKTGQTTLPPQAQLELLLTEL